MSQVSEWVEVRDANGRLLFRYSPMREVIEIKERGLTSEISLTQHRAQWFEALKSKVPLDAAASGAIK